MCFKRPKAPAKSPEELAMEAEGRQERENARLELANQLEKDKAMRLEEQTSKARGLYGVRSLISGSKGGMGFGSVMRSLIG